MEEVKQKEPDNQEKQEQEFQYLSVKEKLIQLQTINKQILKNQQLASEQLKIDYNFIEIFRVKNPGLHVEGLKLLQYLLSKFDKNNCKSLEFDVKDLLLAILVNTKITNSTFELIEYFFEKDPQNLFESCNILLLNNQPKVVQIVLGIIYELVQKYGFSNAKQKTFFLQFKDQIENLQNHAVQGVRLLAKKFMEQISQGDDDNEVNDKQPQNQNSQKQTSGSQQEEVKADQEQQNAQIGNNKQKQNNNDINFKTWKKYHDLKQHNVEQTAPVLKEILNYFKQQPINAPIFVDFLWKFKILIMQAMEIQILNLQIVEAYVEKLTPETLSSQQSKQIMVTLLTVMCEKQQKQIFGIVLKIYELKKQSEISNIMLDMLNNSNQDTVINSLNLLDQLLATYGIIQMQWLSPFYIKLQLLLANKNQSIRQRCLQTLVETFKWTGMAIKHHLQHLKQPQMQEVEKLFSECQLKEMVPVKFPQQAYRAYIQTDSIKIDKVVFLEQIGNSLKDLEIFDKISIDLMEDANYLIVELTIQKIGVLATTFKMKFQPIGERLLPLLFTKYRVQNLSKDIITKSILDLGQSLDFPLIKQQVFQNIQQVHYELQLNCLIILQHYIESDQENQKYVGFGQEYLPIIQQFLNQEGEIKVQAINLLATIKNIYSQFNINQVLELLKPNEKKVFDANVKKFQFLQLVKEKKNQKDQKQEDNQKKQNSKQQKQLKDSDEI